MIVALVTMVKYVSFTHIFLLIIVSGVIRWLKCNKYGYDSEKE